MDGLGESGILFTPLATVQFQQGGMFRSYNLTQFLLQVQVCLM